MISRPARLLYPNAHKLKDFFKARGISQYRIALSVGFCQAYVSQLLTGVRPFNGELAKRLTELAHSIQDEERKAEGGKA